MLHMQLDQKLHIQLHTYPQCLAVGGLKVVRLSRLTAFASVSTLLTPVSFRQPRNPRDGFQKLRCVDHGQLIRTAMTNTAKLLDAIA